MQIQLVYSELCFQAGGMYSDPHAILFSDLIEFYVILWSALNRFHLIISALHGLPHSLIFGSCSQLTYILNLLMHCFF